MWPYQTVDRESIQTSHSAGTMMTWKEAVGRGLPGPLAIGSWDWVQKPDNTGLVIGGDLGNVSADKWTGLSPYGVAADMAEKLLQENCELNSQVRLLKKTSRSTGSYGEVDHEKLSGNEQQQLQQQQQLFTATHTMCDTSLSKSDIYDDISSALLESLSSTRVGEKSRLETTYKNAVNH